MDREPGETAPIGDPRPGPVRSTRARAHSWFPVCGRCHGIGAVHDRARRAGCSSWPVSPTRKRGGAGNDPRPRPGDARRLLPPTRRARAEDELPHRRWYEPPKPAPAYHRPLEGLPTPGGGQTPLGGGRRPPGWGGSAETSPGWSPRAGSSLDLRLPGAVCAAAPRRWGSGSSLPGAIHTGLPKKDPAISRRVTSCSSRSFTLARSRRPSASSSALVRPRREPLPQWPGAGGPGEPTTSGAGPDKDGAGLRSKRKNGRRWLTAPRVG